MTNALRVAGVNNQKLMVVYFNTVDRKYKKTDMGELLDSLGLEALKYYRENI